MYRITSRIIFVLMVVGLSACIPTAPPSRVRLKETAAAVTVQAMVRTLAAPYTQTALYRAVIADITRTALAAGTETPLPETLTPPVSPVPSVVVNPGACNWAGYPIDITYPDGSEVGTGEHIRKVWRIQNLGSCTWNSAYSLVYDRGTQMGAPAYTPITTGSVPPGGSVDVAVDLIAPSSAGSYQVYFRMRAPDGSYVPIGNRSEGTLWAIITTSAPVPCNWAAFLEDINYPDGSRLNAGQEFTKTWRIQNIGTCDWTRDYRLVFVGGDRMGAADFIPITRHVVPPGRILDVSVDLKAPGTPGTYEGWFKLRAADGHVFGIGYNNAQPIWLRIVVAPTPTPTVPTPTPSMTVTPSPTLTPSSTPTPSETPTETLTPSPTNT